MRINNEKLGSYAKPDHESNCHSTDTITGVDIGVIEAQPDPPLTRSSKPRSFYVNVASLCLCVFLVTVNTINFASALPAVASSLHATTTDAFWCGTALLFAQCVAQPIYGALAEALGRKRCLLVALALFALSGLLGGLARTVGWLVAAQSVGGVGSGGINVCVNVIVVDLVPQRERAQLSGVISLAGALGLVVGVLSGSAAAETSWRLMFYINIPIAISALVLLGFFLRLEEQRQELLPRLKTVDWSGIVLLSGSNAGVIFAVIGGGTVHSWESPNVLVPLVIGIVGVIAFVFFEEFIAGKHGLGPAFIPWRLFGTRTAAFGYLITFLHAMILWAIPYYFLLYLHISASRSLVQSSVLILPSTLLVPPAAAVAGIMMSRLSHFKYFNVTAFVLMVAGCAGLSTLRADPTTGQILGFQFLFSIGGGILFPGRLAAVQAAQRHRLDASNNKEVDKPSGNDCDGEEDVRMATSLVSFATSLGQAFGIAMGSTALQNAWNPLVREAVEDGRLEASLVLPASVAASAAEILARFPPEAAAIYREIAAQSVARVWYVCVALAVLGVFAALASRNLDLESRKREEIQVQEGST